MWTLDRANLSGARKQTISAQRGTTSGRFQSEHEVLGPHVQLSVDTGLDSPNSLYNSSNCFDEKRSPLAEHLSTPIPEPRFNFGDSQGAIPFGSSMSARALDSSSRFVSEPVFSHESPAFDPEAGLFANLSVDAQRAILSIQAIRCLDQVMSLYRSGILRGIVPRDDQIAYSIRDLRRIFKENMRLNTSQTTRSLSASDRSSSRPEVPRSVYTERKGNVRTTSKPINSYAVPNKG